MIDYTGKIFKAYTKLGFAPRDNQLEIINNILNSFLDENYTNVVLCAGTGHGKSIIAMVTQLALKEILEQPDSKSNIIMNTNVLIDQYINSFSSLPVEDFFYRKGANNYTCQYITEQKGNSIYGDDYLESAEMCISDCDNKCPYADKCEFNRMKRRQKRAKCVVSNYSYWMTSNLFAKKRDYPLINIFDECHTMNDVFSSFASIKISNKLLENILTLKDIFSTEIKDTGIRKHLNDLVEKEKLDDWEEILSIKFPEEEIKALIQSLKLIEIQDEFDFTGQKLTIEQKMQQSKIKGEENYNHFLSVIIAITPLLRALKKKLSLEKVVYEKEIEKLNNELDSLLAELNRAEKSEKSHVKVQVINKRKEIEEKTRIFVKVTKSFGRISNLLFQIELIKDDKEILFENIIDPEEYGIMATPIFIKKYWDVLNTSQYNLFMSATITKEYLEKTIDLQGTTKFIFIPSSFPKENKLIIDYKSQVLNYNTMQDYNTINNILKSCEEIVNIGSDVNGIILTTTFNLTHKIAERISKKVPSVKVFEHVQGKKVADIIEEFKNTKVPSVLISPSLWEGISLDDDKSRYQIICKTPYGSLASKRNKYIQLKLPEIYQQQTLLTLIQGFGRSVRNKEDYCITYCLDRCTHQEIEKPYNVWKNDYTYETVH